MSEKNLKDDITLFFSIIFREFFVLLKINMLFILYSLPIITIGASYTALNSVIIKLIRNKPIDTVFDFNKAFYENFIKGTFFSFVIFITTLILATMLNFYWITNKLSIFFIITIITLILISINSYVFPLLVCVKTSVIDIYKKSWFLSVNYIKYSILNLILFISLVATCLLLGSVIYIYFLIIGFSIFCLLNSFCTYIAINDYIKEKDEERLINEENKEGTFANTLNQEFERNVD